MRQTVICPLSIGRWSLERHDALVFRTKRGRVPGETILKQCPCELDSEHSPYGESCMFWGSLTGCVLRQSGPGCRHRRRYTSLWQVLR